MWTGETTIAEYNRKVFEEPRIVQEYADKAEITQAEMAIFERFRVSYEGKRVLDIGVGGGRTTPWLAPSSEAYTGIDYSCSMVKHCRQRFYNTVLSMQTHEICPTSNLVSLTLSYSLSMALIL